MYDLTDKKILVLGYARTGESVARFLTEKGARVTVNDGGQIKDTPSIPALKEQGVKFLTGSHPLELLDEGFDFIVKNPGIPYTIPIIQKALEKNIPIYTDVELASWYSKASIIGITGSNGKTTTTTLINDLLKETTSGNSYLAGNIGIPTLDIIKKAQEDDQVVMELSSFQLMGTEKFKVDIAVICNIYSAHLDYHQNQENYEKAKLKLLANLDSQSYFVYRYDQEILRIAANNSPAKPVPFTVGEADEFVRENGAYLENGKIYFKKELIMDTSSVALPGDHNTENILASISVAKIKGVDNQTIQSVTQNFKGISYRIQHVANIDGVDCYNDSKATNTTATITALKSFEDNLVYIGGGLDRGNDFDDLIPYLARIKSAYLYGQTKEKLAQSFEKAGNKNYTMHEDLTQATTAALNSAQTGDTILFSPACASWDQFANFEIRGDAFNKILEDYQKGRD